MQEICQWDFARGQLAAVDQQVAQSFAAVDDEGLERRSVLFGQQTAQPRLLGGVCHVRQQLRQGAVLDHPVEVEEPSQRVLDRAGGREVELGLSAGRATTVILGIVDVLDVEGLI